VRELEDGLIAGLRSWAIDDVHLAAPEVVDWLDIDGFRFSTQSDDHDLDPDPRISSYLSSIQGEVSLEMLKHDRLVAVRGSDGQPMPGWPMLRCLVYEVQSGDHRRASGTA
jgi:uncharacterized protein (TIGR04141 family)